MEPVPQERKPNSRSTIPNRQNSRCAPFSATFLLDILCLKVELFFQKYFAPQEMGHPFIDHGTSRQVFKSFSMTVPRRWFPKNIFS